MSRNVHPFYQDHLGNVRLSYADSNGDGVITKAELIEESNYYPFGMQHTGYNTGTLSSNLGQKIKYNGKELQDELGLNMYDFGARNYDPAIGRWFNIDPKAESYSKVSPYIYALNNPIFFIDPNGKEIKNGDEFASKYYQKAASDELHRLSVYESRYGTSKKDYAGNASAYKAYQNIKRNHSKYQKLADDHAGNIGETARRMKEFETGAPELFSQVNNIKDASGKGIDIFMHVSNTFTAGAFGYTGYTYDDSRDKSGNGLVTIGNNSFYGNNVTVTVNQTPTNDGTLDVAPSTLRVTKHEMGHAFYVITHSKEYVEYLEKLKMSNEDTNGGHYPKSNPSGKTAEEWEQK